VGFRTEIHDRSRVLFEELLGLGVQPGPGPILPVPDVVPFRREPEVGVSSPAFIRILSYRILSVNQVGALTEVENLVDQNLGRRTLPGHPSFQVSGDAVQRAEVTDVRTTAGMFGIWVPTQLLRLPPKANRAGIDSENHWRDYRYRM